jgi:hypothetical protein
MLFARAMSNGCRWFTPDIFLGAAVYTPEELGATVDEDGNVIEISPSSPTPAQLPSIQQDVWRQWRSPSDAIEWARDRLPHMSLDEIQAHFDALETTNGKKAPAWIAKVNELKQIYTTSDERSVAHPPA